MSKRRLSTLTSLVVALAAGLLTTATPASAVVFTPGASGVGDPYFPLEGNGGYDVANYNLRLAYDPATKHLDATAFITAVATQNLSRFDLDLQGLTVTSVLVNGTAATWTRSGQELVITPSAGIVKGAKIGISVAYNGSPQTITGSPIVFGLDYGWLYTDDGTLVAAEPNAASTWYPSNDHPTDKATFTFDVTVPEGLFAAANGDLVSQSTANGSTRVVWKVGQPMAPYLATVDIGRWQLHRSATPAGIPNIVLMDPSLNDDPAPVAAKTGEIVDYWSTVFGTYPYSSTGAIVDNVETVGFSLETQTRPLYSAVRSDGVFAHELAHQWFGDSVSVASWKHIWLSEGFATFAGALWDEHTGVATTAEEFHEFYDTTPADDPFWTVEPGDPGRDKMFDYAVYERGGMTLQALREKVGDPAFFQILRTWHAEHKYGNATTAQFIALAERLSGQQLDDFFTAWLYTSGKPAW